MKLFTDTDFWEHHNSWCADMFFETGTAPGRVRRAILAIELAWFRITNGWWCAAFGCDVVDDDPGNPEVGPQPHVYCVRCGR